MKKFTHIMTVAFVILALLLSTFPASAETIRTSVEGTWEFLGEPPDEEDLDAWGMNVGRDLIPGLYSTVMQCRNDTQFYAVITNEDRMNGFAWGEINCFWHFDIDFNLLGIQVWGTTTIYQDSDYTIPKWDCTFQGRIDAQGNWVQPLVCHGAGVNSGLIAKITLGNSYYDENKGTDIYPLTGYILEPGG